LGISQGTYYNYKSGKSFPDIPVLAAICDFFNVGIEDICISDITENYNIKNDIDNSKTTHKLDHEFLKEKAKWLDEKMKMIDEKKELQDENIRLREEVEELKRTHNTRKVG